MCPRHPRGARPEHGAACGRGTGRAVVRRPLPQSPGAGAAPLPAPPGRSGRGRGRGSGGVREALPGIATTARPPHGLGAWLTRVAVHACRDRRRSRWWRRWWTAATVLDEESTASSWRTPEGQVVGADQQRRIWRAFEQLAPRQREVFVLRHVEGWSTREVADAIGVETGSVKRHLFRAVRHLRTALGEEL